MNKPADSTSVSIFVLFRGTADNQVLPAVAHGDVTAYYARSGETPQPITPLSALGSIDAAYSSGGWIAVPNMAGLYRFDIPDAAWAFGADSVAIHIAATGAYVYAAEFSLEVSTIPARATVQAAASAGAAVVNLPAGLNAHNGSVGVVHKGTGVGSAFVVRDYSTPAATTLWGTLSTALGADSQVVFFAGAAGDAVLDMMTDDATRLDGSSLNSIAALIGALNDPDVAAIVAGVQAMVVEGSITFQQATSAMFSVLCLLIEDGDTNVPRFRNLANTLDRVTVTKDGTGNRTSVVLDFGDL